MGAFRGAFRTCPIQLLGWIGIFLSEEYRIRSGSTAQADALRNSGMQL